MTELPRLPLPHPGKDTEPFWHAAREHRLVMPHCESCGHYTFPPSLGCPRCGHRPLTWIQVSGRGTVFSFVVYHRVYNPAFAHLVPYVVAIIALDEGPRILSNVVGIPFDEVRCDMPVRVVFDEVREEGVVIPQFAPA